jgi:hypothetical protein
MSHIDQDALALLALGEVASDTDAAHLRDCADCRGELAELRRVVSLARPQHADPQQTDPGHGAPQQGAGRDVPLAPPPAAVWDGIAAELGFGIEAHRQPRRGRTRTRITVLVPVVGVVGIVVGLGIAALPGVRTAPAPRPTPAVVSRATLDALPGWGGSRGRAELERSSDGGLELVVDVAAGQPAAGSADPPLREVWMMRSDHSGLVSVGFLDRGRGRFTVPAGVDPTSYPVIDVSAEADDGDPAHSGDSIVRGTLSERGAPA